jgi:formiminotetrahydrofolate cyclodeaminase
MDRVAPPSPCAYNRGVNATTSPLTDANVGDWLETLANPDGPPWGAGAAAIGGAIAAALAGALARRILVRNPPPEVAALASDLAQEADDLRMRLVRLADADIAAYRALAQALRARSSDPAHGHEHDALVRSRWLAATESPLAIAGAAARVVSLALIAGRHGPRSAVPDAIVSAELGHAAFMGAGSCAAANLPRIGDEGVRRTIETALAEWRLGADHDLVAARLNLADFGAGGTSHTGADQAATS